MDWAGQHRAEQLYQALITLASTLALLAAYIQQDLRIAYAGTIIGLVISCLVVVPDWPYLNRHRISWQQSSSMTASTDKTVAQATDTMQVGDDIAAAASRKKGKKQR